MVSAHVTRFYHVGDRADRVFDRHIRVQSRQAIDVDVVGAEALEAVG
jgi:hypothetical protein